MQVNAALRMNQVLRGVAAASRLALPRSVGLASFGARRTRSVVSRSTAAVGVGRPSFGGQRMVSVGSRSGVLRASGASALALSATVARAALPAWSARAAVVAGLVQSEQLLLSRHWQTHGRECQSVQQVRLSQRST
jgi:hypothetical protein